MVHSKLLAEGTQLSFKELRKLERIDAKKEREKALIGLARDGLVAGGRAAQGLFSNQVAGTAAFVVAATALYPAWFPVFEAAVTQITKDIANAWKTGSLPGAPPPFDLPPIPFGRGFKLTIKINPTLGSFVNLFTPLPFPNTQAEFGSAAARAAFIADFKAKAGPLAGLYIYETMDVPP